MIEIHNKLHLQLVIQALGKSVLNNIIIKLYNKL